MDPSKLEAVEDSKKIKIDLLKQLQDMGVSEERALEALGEMGEVKTRHEVILAETEKETEEASKKLGRAVSSEERFVIVSGVVKRIFSPSEQ